MLNAMLLDIISTASMLDSLLHILHMMLESAPLSVSCKSALRSFLDSDHGEKLESLRELLLNEIERNREEYMQSNDEISMKDTYEKESEVLPAALSNVFGVIVLIIPNVSYQCFQLFQGCYRLTHQFTSFMMPKHVNLKQ